MIAVKDAAIRAGRTFVQAAIGTFLASGVLQAVVADGAVGNPDVWQRAAIAAVAAGVIAVVSFVQNVLEDYTNVPRVK